MNRPQTHEYPTSFSSYMEVVDGNVMSHLTKQSVDVTIFFKGLSSKENYAYAQGKWTVKEVLGHLIDTERVMSYRLMCFARGEQQDLPGFDEDAYVKNANFGNKELDKLCEEFSLLRHANIALINSLNETELAKSGSANGKKITVRALAYMLAGHVIHHLRVVRDRYI